MKQDYCLVVISADFCIIRHQQPIFIQISTDLNPLRLIMIQSHY